VNPPEHSFRRFAFLIGDFTRMHRCALIAAQAETGSRSPQNAFVRSLVELLGLKAEFPGRLSESFRRLFVRYRSREPFSTLGLFSKMIGCSAHVHTLPTCKYKWRVRRSFPMTGKFRH
jgi:hypothetical protein